jgi:two-component system, chemotaxis family, sensor histidine kinase and response regulator WspE
VSEPQADLFLLDLFRTELETHGRLLEVGLVDAEGEQPAEKMEPLMRAAHSIKGAARIVGLDAGVKLAHAMEDILSAAQHGQRRLAANDVDLLLRANDVFLKLAQLAPAEIPAACSAQAAAMEAQAAGLSAPPTSAPPPASALPEAPKAAPAAPPQAKAEDGSVRVFVENLDRLAGFAGECLVEVKTLRPLGGALERLKSHHALLGNALEEALEALQKEAPIEAQAHLEEALRRAAAVRAIIPAHMAEFERFSRKLELLANRLYDEAVASRMRPFSDGLHGFPRMVRSLAHDLGKRVIFEIQGEATRVDRDILEKLEAPLNHLLRNALDHGLENPAERVAAGKPEESRVTLAARHVAGALEIAVSDDGRGVDLARMRERIVARGYASAEIATTLSEAEILDFLFLPGFSTAESVTEISGRGVGLDVVQSMVREVGGNLRVEMHAGAGTTFLLQLPLTLSVVRTLLIEIHGEPYAIPLTRVDKVAHLDPDEIKVVENRPFFSLDGRNVGLVDARQALGMAAAERATGGLHVVVLSDRLNRYGLVVDRLLGQRDLVVKPLDARLGKVPNVAASAILEDGGPVLILDAEDLVRSIDNLLTRGELRRVRRPGQAVSAARKRILVVDDSLTVREVERRLLEGHGYEVTAAVDGMDGWNTLQGSAFDLVVTDIDMPRMDGIELVRRIKGAPHTSRIPVMIVSYKEQEEYRMRGLEAGASYYLTKSSFHDERLADAVRDLIGEAVG